MIPMMVEADLARLHQREQAWDSRQRFVFAWNDVVHDPRRRLANAVELEVWAKLEARGLMVGRRARHKEHFDLLAQGVRIEVKAAVWGGEKYLANMHDNQADVVVMACLDTCELGLVTPRFFVIPFEAVGQRTIMIRPRDPMCHVGRWTRYFEAWELVDELVAAGRNAWQLPML
jgi:hypothetical protein